MPNPHISTQDWFYHAPSVRSSGPSCVEIKPPSQIPGLSSLADDAQLGGNGEDDRHCKRKWIRDTDSKYVRLAKAGGRKHLLAFNTNSKLSAEPVVYPRVDWFDHNPEEKPEESNKPTNIGVLPEWYVHEPPLPSEDSSDNTKVKEENTSDGPKQNRPMLGYDSLSVWQRNGQQSVDEKQSESKRLPQLQKTKKKIKLLRPSSRLGKVSVKLPKLQRSNEVNGSKDLHLDMKRLLSMDYQREWLFNKSIEESKEAESKEALEKEKQEREKRIENHHQQSRKTKKPTNGEKPLFKISRFCKVKSCVDTRWSKLESTKKSVAH